MERKGKFVLNLNLEMMKKSILFLVCLTIPLITFANSTPPQKPRTFLFVHGAWGGGWEYKDIDSILTANGDIVFRPTMTGLGERVHLAHTEVDLNTHIKDIVNVSFLKI